MKALKTMFMGATALTMMAGVAYADTLNSAETAQTGVDNSMSVEQDSGTKQGNNIAGTTATPITQNGNHNDVDINQLRTLNNNNSFDNTIGTKGAGITQSGDLNVLTIDQAGARHAVHEVQQNGGSGSTGTHNSIEINQTGLRQTTSGITQTFTGTDADAANEVMIRQQGGSGNLIGNTTSGPRPERLRQTGYGNMANIEQMGGGNHLYELNQTNSNSGGGANNAEVTETGSSHYIRLIEQENTGGLDNTVSVSQSGTDQDIENIRQLGEDNSATVTQSDSLNKLELLSQDGIGNQAMVSQSNTPNSASIDVLGDYNITDVTQSGVNGLATISITGSASNNVSIGQTGGSAIPSNVGAVTITDGADGNIVAMTQDGNNSATVDIVAGDYNDVSVDQNGTNTADIDINTGSGNYTHGDYNRLNVMQNDGSTAANSMTVSITGSYNNNPLSGHAPLLAGDAAAARNTGVSLSSLDHLYKGDLYQDGSGNDINLTVGSNNNAFAMLQVGADNSISGTISGGAGSNQAVVVQMNANNAATFSQSGFGNNLGIVQNGQ